MDYEQLHALGMDEHTLMDYEQMKDRLTLQLIPTEGNEEKLAAIPHRDVEDMALIYRFELARDEERTASVLVTNDMLKTYGITADQLHDDAVEIAAKNRPATLRNMNEVMRDMLGEMSGVFIPDEPSPIWVATVVGDQNGASVLQYPGFLDQAAEVMGGDFYVLPSSIHEVLFVPDDGSLEIGNLEVIVHGVNETEVKPAERLSENVYHYDSEAHIFENARTFEAREAARGEEQHSAEPSERDYDEAAAGGVTMLLVEPGEHPKVVEMGTELEDLQKGVGGYIETVYPFDDNVGLIVNEEGKINGLPLNRALRDENQEVCDIIAGSFLITGITEEGFGSLSTDQIGKYEEMFHQPEAFVKLGHSIMAIPIPEETMEARETARAKAPEKIDDKPGHKKPEHDGR